MAGRGLLTLSPDGEPLWVRLYVHQIEDRWVAMLVADDVTPLESEEMATIYAKVTKEDKLRAANALARTYSEVERKREARWPRRTPKPTPHDDASRRMKLVRASIAP
jgi:hypothetical protein